MITIGERIKELRKERKISQAELAKNINVSPGNVGDWERGKAKPGADALISLMNYFSVSADWLLTGKGSNENKLQHVTTTEEINSTRKSIDSDVSILTEEERGLILSFRHFDELDKELVKNTVDSLLKRLEKNSILGSYIQGEEDVATKEYGEYINKKQA